MTFAIVVCLLAFYSMMSCANETGMRLWVGPPENLEDTAFTRWPFMAAMTAFFYVLFVFVFCATLGMA